MLPVPIRGSRRHGVERQVTTLSSDPDHAAALITGAASGIGRALVEALRDEGWQVIGWDIVEDREVRPVDVSDWAAVQAASGDLPPLDLVVHSAGVGNRDAVLTLGPDAWNELIGVNLTGAFYVARHVASKLAERSGVLVNIASIAAHVGFRNRAAYSTSKAGLVALTKCLAIEFAELGVRAFSVSPTFTESPMAHEGFSSGRTSMDDVLDHTPQRRLLKPDELAQAIVRLAQPPFDSLTGADVALDCGFAAFTGF